MGGPLYIYGAAACECIAATLPYVEARLRSLGLIRRDLSGGLITQGAWSTGVAASAGTHAGGGVWDVAWRLVSTDAAVRAWRECSWIMWPRTTAQGFSAAHGHGIVYGCPHLSGAAAVQVSHYHAGLNGLASRGRDTSPRPTIPTWQQLAATATTTTTEDTMTPEQAQQLREIYDRIAHANRITDANYAMLQALPDQLANAVTTAVTTTLADLTRGVTITVTPKER